MPQSSASSSSSLCTPLHAYLCFQALEAELRIGQEEEKATAAAGGFVDFEREIEKAIKEEGGAEKSAQLKDEYPVFVTWNKYPTTNRSSRSRNDDSKNIQEHEEPRLRGCIGTFHPLPLGEGLRDYAITSALHDSRFQPISARELPLLQCGVSLLTPFEPVDTPLDWDLGKHGIHITFQEPPPSSSSFGLRGGGRRYSATYLPEVAPAQGWTKEETIISLIRKAGYRGKVQPPSKNGGGTGAGDALWSTIQTKRYRSEKCQVDWEDYVRWKEGVHAKVHPKQHERGEEDGVSRRKKRKSGSGGIEQDEEDVEAEEGRMVVQEA